MVIHKRRPAILILLCIAVWTTVVWWATTAGAEDWLLKGNRLMKAEQPDAAIEAYSKALEILAHDFEAYNNRGVAWMMKTDYARARADFSRAVALNPGLAKAFCNRSVAAFHLQQFGATIADATRALAIRPCFYEAYSSRAAAWIETNDYPRGIADYRRALKVQNGNCPDFGEDLPAGEGGSQTGSARPPNRNVLLLTLQNRDVASAGLAAYIKKLESQFKLAGKVRQTKDPEKVRNAIGPTAGVAVPSPAPQPVPPRGQPAIAVAKRQAPNQPPAIGKVPFAVHILSFKTAADAVEVARELTRAGTPAVASPIQIPHKGMWHRVYLGFFHNRGECERAAAARDRRKFAYALIQKLPFAVRVTVNAGGQLQEKDSARLQTLGFNPYRVEDAPGPAGVRFLIGAFRSRPEAQGYVAKLRAPGWELDVVKR